MGKHLAALSGEERAAVAAHVRAEYDKLVFQQPATYVAKHAQSNPEGWQDALCELICGDRERVEDILEKARRDPEQQQEFPK